MRGIAVLASAGIPDAPTIGTAVAGNAGGTITFTPGAYLGKTGVVTYEVTSTPGGLSGTGASSPIILGLTNGTSYTFTVTAVTNYGVSSAASSASNSITPAAPPAPPPGPPPPPPPPPCSCAPQPWPNNCTRVYPNTCDGQVTYEYYDCGCSQTCPGTGGYNGAYIIGSCGYTGPVNCGSCGDGGFVSNGCGGYIAYDGCGNQCSDTGCPACANCGDIGPCCGSCSYIKDGYACI